MCDDKYHKAGVAVLEQIKKQISESINKQERIQILTLAPEFWPRKDLMREFDCSSKLLPADIVNSENTFYGRDDINRLMPDLKDYVSIKQSNGERKHVQKDYCLVIKMSCIRSKESYEETALKLKPRLDKAKSVPGRLQYHSIISRDESTLKLKKNLSEF